METVDNIVNILEDYYRWECEKKKVDYNNLSKTEKERLRLKFDNDAFYYKSIGFSDKDALYADTIISFWSICKRLLFIETGWKTAKTEKALKALLYQIKFGNKEYAANIRLVNEIIRPFADVCYTKGNYMLLPDKSMQYRYEITEDRIDWTLYDCLPNG